MTTIHPRWFFRLPRRTNVVTAIAGSNSCLRARHPASLLSTTALPARLSRSFSSTRPHSSSVPADRPHAGATKAETDPAGQSQESDIEDVLAIVKAREFVKYKKAEAIPRRIGFVTFSRSSGPGGQNVNKLNTKASLRVSMTDLGRYVPKYFYPFIRESRYFAANSSSLVIQSDESRSQTVNLDTCWRKMYDLLTDIAASNLPREISAEDQRRVDDLRKKRNEARIAQKKLHSGKKAGRRSYDD